jgi:hypothetical protein
MKKLLSMFAVLTLLTSCGETTTEKEVQDSTKVCCDQKDSTVTTTESDSSATVDSSAVAK